MFKNVITTQSGGSKIAGNNNVAFMPTLVPIIQCNGKEVENTDASDVSQPKDSMSNNCCIQKQPVSKLTPGRDKPESNSCEECLKLTFSTLSHPLDVEIKPKKIYSYSSTTSSCCSSVPSLEDNDCDSNNNNNDDKFMIKSQTFDQAKLHSNNTQFAPKDCCVNYDRRHVHISGSDFSTCSPDCSEDEDSENATPLADLGCPSINILSPALTHGTANGTKPCSRSFRRHSWIW